MYKLNSSETCIKYFHCHSFHKKKKKHLLFSCQVLSLSNRYVFKRSRYIAETWAM